MICTRKAADKGSTVGGRTAYPPLTSHPPVSVLAISLSCVCGPRLVSLMCRKRQQLECVGIVSLPFHCIMSNECIVSLFPTEIEVDRNRCSQRQKPRLQESGITRPTTFVDATMLANISNRSTKMMSDAVCQCGDGLEGMKQYHVWACERLSRMQVV